MQAQQIAGKLKLVWSASYLWLTYTLMQTGLIWTAETQSQIPIRRLYTIARERRKFGQIQDDVRTRWCFLTIMLSCRQQRHGYYTSKVLVQAVDISFAEREFMTQVPLLNSVFLSPPPFVCNISSLLAGCVKEICSVFSREWVTFLQLVAVANPHMLHLYTRLKSATSSPTWENIENCGNNINQIQIVYYRHMESLMGAWC